MRVVIKRVFIFHAILAFSMLFAIDAFSVTRSEAQAEIEKAAQQLTSQDIQERLQASEYLKKLGRDELGPGLLSQVVGQFLREIAASKQFNELTLRPEDGLSKVPRELLVVNSEAWIAYFMNLRDIAAKSGDLEILPELIAYKVSPNALDSYGEAAIGPLLDSLKSLEATPNSSVHGRRLYAAQALVSLIKEREKGFVARGAAKERVAKALIDCARNDSDDPLRAVVVKSFGDLGDPEFVPVLEDLSRNDRWSYEALSDPRFDKDIPPGQKIKRHPIRKMAGDALAKIRRQAAR